MTTALPSATSPRWTALYAATDRRDDMEPVMREELTRAYTGGSRDSSVDVSRQTSLFLAHVPGALNVHLATSIYVYLSSTWSHGAVVYSARDDLKKGCRSARQPDWPARQLPSEEGPLLCRFSGAGSNAAGCNAWIWRVPLVQTPEPQNARNERRKTGSRSPPRTLVTAALWTKQSLTVWLFRAFAVVAVRPLRRLL